MAKHHHIVIIGNVASGKSTLMQSLANELPALAVPADELYLVNPFFAQAVKDRARWSFASDVWFLRERVKMMKEMEKNLRETSVVVDSGLLMSWVYAHSRVGSQTMTSHEWELYQELYESMTNTAPQPDAVVFLAGDPKFLRKRIIQRGREFEVKHHNEEYLKSLSESLSALQTRLMQNNLPVLSFTTNEQSQNGQEWSGQVKKRIQELV